MIGTYVNIVAIIIGTTIGCLLKKGIKEQYRNTLMQGMGLSAVALGVNAIVSNMGKSTIPVMFIVSIALGGLIGQRLNLSDNIDKLGAKYSKGSNLEGLMTAILLFCFGTLAILGPIESALNNNHTYLFTNATLDFITSIVLASNFGISIMFVAVVLFITQGSIYVGATFLEPFITPELLTEVGIVGGMLILSTGLSILKIKDIKTINYLPALLIPPLYFLIKNLIF